MSELRDTIEFLEAASEELDELRDENESLRGRVLALEASYGRIESLCNTTIHQLEAFRDGINEEHRRWKAGVR